MSASTAASSQARELGWASDVLALLHEASGTRSVALVRGTCEPLGSPGRSQSGLGLGVRLLELMRSTAHAGGAREMQLFEPDTLETLGHAPLWERAGALYEELLARSQNEGAPTYIFCLDPWSAQILSRMNESFPSARWILISDLARRKGGQDQDYWEKLDEWLRALAFFAIVPLDVLTEVTEKAEIALPLLPHSTSEGRTVLEKPGAWQWRRLRRAAPPARRAPPGYLLFVSPFSGSLPHLGVFLRCLVRQEYPQSHLGLLLLVRQASGDLETFLKWHRLVHPEMRIEALVASLCERNDWENEVRTLLAKNPAMRIAWLHDHVLLPAKLAQAIDRADRDGARIRLGSLPLSLEISGRILLGEEDPIVSYEKLITPFREALQAGVLDPSGEHGFALPSGLGKGRETELLIQIGAYFEGRKISPTLEPSAQCNPIDLLRVGDLR